MDGTLIYVTKNELSQKTAKIFEIIYGLYTCYVCSGQAETNYETFRVCHGCCKELNKVNKIKSTLKYKGDVFYRRDENYWHSGQRDCIKIQYKFLNPEGMLKIRFLDMDSFAETINCVGCDRTVYCRHHYDQIGCCAKCWRFSKRYFDSKPKIYLLLRELVMNDVAKYTVYIYYKTKLWLN